MTTVVDGGLRLPRAPGLNGQERAEARRRLETIAAMGDEALAEDAERFRATYGRVGMLPPDQYLALALQATQGCSWEETGSRRATYAAPPRC